jgi:uncharacterized membrane protein YuzA (DUF378 family)
MEASTGDKESGLNPPDLPERLNLAQKTAIFIIRLAGLWYFLLGLEGVAYWAVYLILGNPSGGSMQLLNQIMYILVGLAAMFLGRTVGKLLGRDLG